MTALILKRASASRPSGEWNEDDYDVIADSMVVGRIMRVAAAPVGSPWMWTSAIMRIARRRTAIPQRAKPPWRHSQKAGAGSRCAETFNVAHALLRRRAPETRPVTNPLTRWRGSRLAHGGIQS
jgi:hypothetical protein